MACREAIAKADRLAMSAGTLIETYIVALRKKRVSALNALLEGLQIEIVAVEGEKADHIRTVYERYGKGFHPARLNFGDCFAYALAETRDCPLLYVGNDFTRTGIRPALSQPAN